MRDYWLTQYILAAVGWGYLLVSLAAIALALWLPKGKRAKAIATLIALGVASILPLEGYQGYQKQKEAAELYRAKLAKAQALFAERCKTAGEKIYRTVEGVDGVLLKNARGTLDRANYRDRNWEGAGFPGESSGNQYVMEFLFYNIPARGDSARSLGPKPGGVRGYRYVEVDEGGVTARYTLREEANYTPVGASDPVARYGARVTARSPRARYAVIYENISDPEARASWVAGGRVKVVDQANGEVLGEFIRYAFEPGLGSTDGERLPWAFAEQCPLSSYGGRTGHIRSFVEQVAKPKQGE